MDTNGAPWTLIKNLHNNLVQNIVGVRIRDGLFHCRFRSTPANEHRWLFLDKIHLYLPFTTPSGLSIGIILNIHFSRRVLAVS